MEYVRLKDINFKDNVGNRLFVSFLSRDVTVDFQRDKVTRCISLKMVDKDKVEDAKIFGANDSMIKKVVSGHVYNAIIDVKKYSRSSKGYSCIVFTIEESNLPPDYFADWMDNINESRQVIQDKLEEIYNTNYGKIAYKILIEQWDKFACWSAAKNMHHNKLGGLMVHTAEVVQLAQVIGNTMAQVYGERFINKPLLLASALLHDIGKIDELEVDAISGNTEYSINGALEPHIIRGICRIEMAAYNLGIGQKCEGKSDADLAQELEELMLLRHCILAHHGKLEYGSPVKPAIPEAYILSKADEIDAEVYWISKVMKDTKAGSITSTWIQDGYKSVYRESDKKVAEQESKLEI